MCAFNGNRCIYEYDYLMVFFIQLTTPDAHTLSLSSLDFIEITVKLCFFVKTLLVVFKKGFRSASER